MMFSLCKRETHSREVRSKLAHMQLFINAVTVSADGVYLWSVESDEGEKVPNSMGAVKHIQRILQWRMFFLNISVV